LDGQAGLRHAHDFIGDAVGFAFGDVAWIANGELGLDMTSS
jgi:hypothetical protein